MSTEIPDVAPADMIPPSAKWIEPAVRWIELILRERFVPGLRLEWCGEVWRIRLNGSDRAIEMDAHPVMFTRCDPCIPCSTWSPGPGGWQPACGTTLPAPGAAFLCDPLIEATSDGYAVHYDILGFVYWMLTRTEEIGFAAPDEHGRFPAKSSHAFKHGYLARPIVDEWLDVLRQVMESTWPGADLLVPQFHVAVSHDVDRPSLAGFQPWRRALRGGIGDILKRRDIRGLLRPWLPLASRRRLQAWDRFNTFDWLMAESEQRDLRSAFYFICDRRATPYDSDYDVGHAAIRELIRRIHRRGHEIGLHPSYNTYLNPAQIALEAQRLRRVCREEGVCQPEWGGRMHYLQWRQPVTLRAWSDAGMAYDSTMAYADHAGFRCGTCFEYPAFDSVAGEPLALRIRPLVVMDGSLFGEHYMNLSGKAALDGLLGLKETCRKVRGCFSVLWHNSSLQTRTERNLYKAALDG